MSRDNDELKSEHPRRTWEKRPTVTLEWKMPIGLVLSFVSLCVYGTALYFGVIARIDKSDNELRRIEQRSVNEKQARTWIDNFRDYNPTLHTPPLPDKPEVDAMLLLDNQIASGQRKDTKIN